MNDEKVDNAEHKVDRGWSNAYKVFIISILLLILLRTKFQMIVVSGNSMLPTLHNRDFGLVGEEFLAFNHYNRGDIVILSNEGLDIEIEHHKDSYIKRIIGIPGDRVRITDGKIYINDKLYKEPYIVQGLPTEKVRYNDCLLGEDEYYVVGDNRYHGASMDSRYFGKINKKNIKGKLLYILFPKENRKSYIDNLNQ